MARIIYLSPLPWPAAGPLPLDQAELQQMVMHVLVVRSMPFIVPNQAEDRMSVKRPVGWLPIQEGPQLASK